MLLNCSVVNFLLIFLNTVNLELHIQYPETEYGTFTLGIIPKGSKDQKTKRSVGSPLL